MPAHGYSDVTRQIRKETGWMIGDYIVNFIVEHSTRRWVDSRSVMHHIYTDTGYKLEINQISNVLFRWATGSYRVDGVLEKHKTKRGSYRWIPAGPKPEDTLVEHIPVKDFLGVDLLDKVKSGARANVVLENPVKKYQTMDHDTDGIMIVTSIVGGYLIKIDGHLYTAKKLEI